MRHEALSVGVLSAKPPLSGMGDERFIPTATLVMKVGDRIFYPCTDDTPSFRSFFEMLEGELQITLRNRGD